MKKIFTKGIFLLALIAIVVSCQKEIIHKSDISKKGILVEQSSQSEDLMNNQQIEKSDECNHCNYNIFTYNIINSSMNNVGTMRLTNNDTRFSITFKTTNGWLLNEIHLFAGDIANLPILNGNLNLNGFSVNKVFNSPTNLYSIKAYLNSLPPCFSIVATGTATDTYGNLQQVWVYGIQLPGTKFIVWYNTYCIQQCQSKT